MLHQVAGNNASEDDHDTDNCEHANSLTMVSFPPRPRD
jgi:hypothetical protein